MEIGTVDFATMKKIEEGEYKYIGDVHDDLVKRNMTGKEVVIINKEWLDKQENPVKMINFLTKNGNLKHMIV